MSFSEAYSIIKMINILFKVIIHEIYKTGITSTIHKLEIEMNISEGIIIFLMDKKCKLHAVHYTLFLHKSITNVLSNYLTLMMMMIL